MLLQLAVEVVVIVVVVVVDVVGFDVEAVVADDGHIIRVMFNKDMLR